MPFLMSSSTSLNTLHAWFPFLRSPLSHAKSCGRTRGSKREIRIREYQWIVSLPTFVMIMRFWPRKTRKQKHFLQTSCLETHAQLLFVKKLYRYFQRCSCYITCCFGCRGTFNFAEYITLLVQTWEGFTEQCVFSLKARTIYTPFIFLFRRDDHHHNRLQRQTSVSHSSQFEQDLQAELIFSGLLFFEVNRMSTLVCNTSRLITSTPLLQYTFESFLQKWSMIYSELRDGNVGKTGELKKNHF